MSEQHLLVHIEDLSSHPICQHGPTLLFSRRPKLTTQKRVYFFACSACRDRKECTFYLEKTEKFQKWHNNEIINSNNMRSSINIENIKLITPKKRQYCHSCNLFVINNREKHKNHDRITGITDDLLQTPTKLLKTLQNDKKEAQYFFSESTLKCFVSIFKQFTYRKIICIGTPRLHEYLKCNWNTFNMDSILLDIDKRYEMFFNQNDFLWYNMFNDHFFYGNDDQIKFEMFLKEPKTNNSICLIVDPPFGCRTEPLAETIRKISRKYQEINKFSIILPIFWIFPYFMENYIQRVMPELHMNDYKINYINHESYNNNYSVRDESNSDNKGRKFGSPIRFFSNLKSIKLPIVEGYKFCKSCIRWTAKENLHCIKCMKCPSKNGSTYVHCANCNICVKPNYKHCYNCNRCTQIENHRCAEYQKYLKCSLCKTIGHTELNCSKLSQMKKTKIVNRKKTKSRNKLKRNNRGKLNKN